MFVDNKSVKACVCGEGQTRKILGAGGSLMMVEVTFAKGAVGTVHSHPHEQVSYVVRGSFEFNLDGDKRTIMAGDSVYVPSNVKHGVMAFEEGSVIVDVFTPQREDFLNNK
mgnify:CR=1 FL=1